MYELLNDEESYVRIEVIEAVLEVLEHLELKTIETEFIPNFLKALVVNNNHDEIVARMARLIGPIVHKLSAFDLHLKYKEPILTFYKEMINHRDEDNVLCGIYNLPCFNLLYKDAVSKPPPGTAATQSTATTGPAVAPEHGIDLEEDGEFKATEIDFFDLYYKYGTEASEEMRAITAACLHEAFKLAAPTEDISKLQMTLKELLEEDSTQVILGLARNIDVLVRNFCNEHVLAQVPDPVPPAEDSTPTRGFGLLHSHTAKASDFSA